jgi:Mce-associated membrane protein
MSKVETVDDTEQTGVSDTDTTPDEATTLTADATNTNADDTADDGAGPSRSRAQWRRIGLAVLVATAIAGVVFGYLRYNATADDLARMRHAEADRNTAAQLAKDYALKSLTYSFKDPDAFFRSVEQGVSPTLKDKFVNATGFLKSVMLQAQVTSTGEVVATDPIPEPGDVYEVVVSTYQNTRNVQNPEPRVSVMLLQVIVNKVGDSWQVSDIGPKPGSQASNADPVPLPEPGLQPGAPAPVPGR